MAEVPIIGPERSLTTYNNSFAAKSSLAQQQKEEETKPKLQATIQGGVTLRRKTPGQRFTETFLNNGDIQTVGQTILMDVIIPAFKEMIFNSVRDGFSMLLWGDTRASRSGGLSSRGGIVRDYSSYSSSIGSRSRDRDRVDIYRPEDSPRYNNLVFQVRGDAENILFNMRDYINTYNDIQIVKLYELVEEQTGINIPMTAQDAKFGWSDLTNAGIRQVRGGYLLELPNPIVLER
jgi:hypothetical protein